MRALVALRCLFGIFALLLLSHEPLLRAAERKPGSEADWETTIEAAKKEGKLSVYFWQGGNLEKAIQAFQKKYPEIQLSSVAGRGSSFVVRITTEMRAGKYLADICICGVTSPYAVLHQKANALESIKSAFILPEVIDESKWWEGKHHYQDPERQFIFAYWGRPAATRVAYNTKQVNPGEFKSYWDLLQPRWKGKMVAVDPIESAGGWRGLYYKPGLEEKFLRQLFGEMDVTMIREDRQGVDWLATGRFSLGLFLTQIPQAKGQGLPVDEFLDSNFKEPPNMDTGPNGTIALMKQAPHPNAAKVFINWFLSREGQTTYQEIMNTRFDYVESMREDISKDAVPPEYRRRKGIKYIPMFTPEHMDADPVLRLYKEATKR